MAAADYLFATELDDYNENYRECKGHHIFEDACVLHNWVYGTSWSPTDHVHPVYAAEGGGT